MRYLILVVAMMLAACDEPAIVAKVPSVVEDPATIDENFPPAVIELGIDSHGARMNGHIYLANGPGPHPTVALLHGFPGKSGGVVPFLAYRLHVFAATDEQPFITPAQTHEIPFAFQLVAVQDKVKLSTGELLERRLAQRLKGSLVPDHDRAAAVLVVGDGAFEITIVERMILDLDREPLVVRIERRPARHRPGLEDAVEFEPKIIMQPRRIMLLDHEPPRL